MFFSHPQRTSRPETSHMQLSECHNFLLSEEEADAEEQTGQQPGPKEVTTDEEEADAGYFSQIHSDLHEEACCSASTPAAKMSSDACTSTTDLEYPQLPTTTGDRTLASSQESLVEN